MEIHSELLALCVWNQAINGGFPSLKTVIQSFDIFFDVSMNKLLKKTIE